MTSGASPPEDFIRAIVFVLCVVLVAGIGQRMLVKDRSFQSGLLALAVAVSVGVHIGLTPEHYGEMPRLGVSFVFASVVGAAIAIALVRRPDDRRLVAAGGIFCLGEIVVWLLFVTVPVPLFAGTPEPVEWIAVVSKAVEAVGVVFAVGLLGSPVLLLKTGARELRRVWETHAQPRLAESSSRVTDVLRPRSMTVEKAPASVSSLGAAGEADPEPMVPAMNLSTSGERFHEQVDELFGSGRDVSQVLQEVARLGGAALLQSAMEAQVTEVLSRTTRDAGGEWARNGHRNGTTPVTRTPA